MMVADYGDRNRLPALLTGALLLLSVGACGPTVEVDGDEDGFKPRQLANHSRYSEQRAIGCFRRVETVPRLC